MLKKVSLIVLVNKNKILLYKRDNKPSIPHPNYWALIGGSLEKKETPSQAVKREIFEEIEYNTNKIKFLESFLIERYTTVFDHIIFLFTGPINKSASELYLTEGQKLCYFSFDDIKNLKMFGPIKKALFRNKDEILKFSRS